MFNSFNYLIITFKFYTHSKMNAWRWSFEVKFDWLTSCHMINLEFFHVFTEQDPFISIWSSHKDVIWLQKSYICTIYRQSFCNNKLLWLYFLSACYRQVIGFSQGNAMCTYFFLKNENKAWGTDRTVCLVGCTMV